MPSFELALADILVIIAYVVVILAIGFRVSRRTATTEDYFLAGRSLTWPLIGFSLFASNISSSTLIGLAGEAYQTGIAVYNYEWMAAVILVFFVIFFLPFYLKTRIYTLPEYLERRYDQRSRYYMSGLTIIANILIETAAALYAGSLVVNLILPEIPLWQVTSVLALLAGLYTVAGGLKAVVYTDAIQAVLLILGSALVAILAYVKVGSWEAIEAVTTARDFSLVQPLDDPTLPWLGLITGVPLLGFYFWCNNQFMVQRTLGARNLDEGRWGALFAGALKIPVLFIMVFPGIFARVLYPDLENADMVFPTMIFDLLPVGLRGLILVALIAAIMSSLDSTLNAISTLVTMDFVKKLRPDTDNRRLVRIGRLATIVVMILGALWAPQITRFPSLWHYLQLVLAYISPPIVALFLTGVFWKRANADGAFAALMVGLAMSIALLLSAVDLHFLYTATLLFVVSTAVVIVVSLLTEAPPSEKQKLVWSVEDFKTDTLALEKVVWYKNYRVQSVILLILTFAVVGYYF